MEPDRFGDVEFRVMERPDPPRRPPRMRRWVLALAGGVLALAGGVLAAGALAAGASALGGGEDRQQARDAAPPEARTNFTYTDRGTPYARDGRDCEMGKQFGGDKRERRSADARH